MLSVSQPVEPTDLPTKRCSLSSLTTSDYFSLCSDSLGTFSPTVKQLEVSSDYTLYDDCCIELYFLEGP